MRILSILLALLVGASFFLTAAETTHAGNQLSGSKSYRITTRSGADAGSVTTTSSGTGFTYTPSDGSPATDWVWDATRGAYVQVPNPPAPQANTWEFFFGTDPWSWVTTRELANNSDYVASGSFDQEIIEVGDPQPL